MVTIDLEKCIGCARCAADCFRQNIYMEDKKAHLRSDSCMQCGHCVAICPTNAYKITDYDMDDVSDMTPQQFSATELLSFIKCRRSIRQFKAQPVERKLLTQVIDAGRYTPTAGNRQELSFIVIEKDMAHFRDLVINNLGTKGRALLADAHTAPLLERYAQLWLQIEDAHKKDPNAKDDVFLAAPAVILLAGDHPVDAGLAASNMELVACANGLGVLYSGFITRGAENASIKATYGVPEGKDILIAMVLGYPDVHYKRSAPRQKADVIWK